MVRVGAAGLLRTGTVARLGFRARVEEPRGGRAEMLGSGAIPA
ncbi:hypothetical protein [Streptomyces niveiscabiei]|uniref:Uncharacterized protein n=1 Tax=Streptomyces niveiscabiei TaxID=164115 RepID=A0ABW9HPC7_9ACTN